MVKKKLILDIGNTRVKFAVFVGDEIFKFQQFNDEELNEALKKNEIESAIISSVRNKEFTENIASYFNRPIILGDQTPLPISNLYDTPETLGNDRIANAVGAWCMNPNENSLIIDAGTCLKFDFINNNGEYLGGSIGPGLIMRFQALHTFTDNLPLIDEMQSESFIGNSTSGSIRAGVIDGVVAEILGMINNYKCKFENLKVVLTGGDSELLETLVNSQKNSIFADKFITLKGLNEILKYND